MIRSRALATTALVTLMLAACGGGSSGTTSPTTPTGATAGPTAPASTDETPTEGTPTEGTPTSGPVETPGNPSTAGVCDLVTSAELQGILGGTVTLKVIPGPPDTCDIEVDAQPSAAIVMTTGNGRMVYDVLAAGSDAQPVSGVGDAAFYSADTQLLVVAKGSTMLSIAVTDDALADADRLDVLKQIGTLAAGRL
jgi:hypothetical protein